MLQSFVSNSGKAFANNLVNRFFAGPWSESALTGASQRSLLSPDCVSLCRWPLDNKLVCLCPPFFLWYNVIFSKVNVFFPLKLRFSEICGWLRCALWSCQSWFAWTEMPSHSVILFQVNVKDCRKFLYFRLTFIVVLNVACFIVCILAWISSERTWSGSPARVVFQLPGLMRLIRSRSQHFLALLDFCDAQLSAFICQRKSLTNNIPTPVMQIRSFELEIHSAHPNHTLKAANTACVYVKVCYDLFSHANKCHIGLQAVSVWPGPPI